jgi:hypothetical protein
MSVIAGNGASKVDPNLVRTLARRLLKLQQRVSDARQLTERTFDEASSKADRATLGQLSISISAVEDHLVESVETWRDLNPELFKE